MPALGTKSKSATGPKGLVSKRGRPSRAETELLNEHLLDVAENLFLTFGFEGTSMDELALKARASKRTIYHRYPNKDALFEAVIERTTHRLLHDLDAPIGVNVEARLECLGLSLIDRILRPETLNLFRVVIAEAARFRQLAATIDERGRVRVITFVTEVLQREVEMGALDIAGPVRTAAEHFLNIASVSILLQALTGNDIRSLRSGAPRHVAQGVEIFLRGCQKVPFGS